MDAQTKKMIGVVLILVGIAAVGVIGYDYSQYLQAKNSGGIFSGLTSWRWTSGEIFQMIAGFISMGAGIFLLNNVSENK